MNITLRHTEFLLTAHDCVVISGLGAFLRRRHPAYFTFDGTLMPPAYSYAFNPELLVSDGLLENSISRSLSVPHVRATALIERDVEAMRHQLEHEGRLPIGRIGDLVLGEEDGSILFEGREKDMLTPMASWLPVVPDPEKATQTEETESAVILQPQRRNGMRILRRVAAVAAVAAVAILTSTPISVNNASLASTALPSVTAPRTAYVPSTKAATISLPDEDGGTVLDTAARSAWQHRKSQEQPAVAPKEVKNDVPEAVELKAEKGRPTIHFNADDEYIVVVASLTSREDAEKFIRDASRRYGGRYGISTKDGSSYFRVYAATGVTTQQARAAINNGSLSHFSGAWVTSNP